eukprot:746876-Hanusia_phi.AAC.5
MEEDPTHTVLFSTPSFPKDLRGIMDHFIYPYPHKRSKSSAARPPKRVEVYFFQIQGPGPLSPGREPQPGVRLCADSVSQPGPGAQAHGLGPPCRGPRAGEVPLTVSRTHQSRRDDRTVLIMITGNEMA